MEIPCGPTVVTVTTTEYFFIYFVFGLCLKLKPVQLCHSMYLTAAVMFPSNQRAMQTQWTTKLNVIHSDQTQTRTQRATQPSVTQWVLYSLSVYWTGSAQWVYSNIWLGTCWGWKLSNCFLSPVIRYHLFKRPSHFIWMQGVFLFVLLCFKASVYFLAD